MIIAKNEDEARHIAYNYKSFCSTTNKFWRPCLKQSDAEMQLKN